RLRPRRVSVVHAAEAELGPRRGQRPGVVPGLLAGAQEPDDDRHGMQTAAAGTAPSRSTRTGETVQSTTVDAAPASSPPSTTSPVWPTAAAAAAAVGGVRAPWRLALVVASGPTARHRSRTSAWSGQRRPTVVPSPPISASHPGALATTTVSGPGHHRSARRRADGGTGTAA